MRAWINFKVITMKPIKFNAALVMVVSAAVISSLVTRCSSCGGKTVNLPGKVVTVVECDSFYYPVDRPLPVPVRVNIPVEVSVLDTSAIDSIRRSYLEAIEAANADYTELESRLLLAKNGELLELPASESSDTVSGDGWSGSWTAAYSGKLHSMKLNIRTAREVPVEDSKKLRLLSGMGVAVWKDGKFDVPVSLMVESRKGFCVGVSALPITVGGQVNFFKRW